MSEPFETYGSNAEEPASSLPPQLRDPVGVWKRHWRAGLLAFLILAIPAVIGSRLIPVEYEAVSRMLLSSKAIPDEFVPDTIVANSSEQFEAIQNRVMTRNRLAKLVATDAFVEDRADRSVTELTDYLIKALLIEKKAISDGHGMIRSIEIRVSLRGERPKQVSEVVNQIVDDLIDEYLAYRSQQSQVTLDFMRREYERADEALRKHQRDLAAFRANYRGSLPEEQSSTIAKLERLESQRQSAILEINDAHLQLASLRAGAGNRARGPTPREQLEADLEKLRALYTDEHPEVLALQRRIAALDTEQVASGQTQANASSRARVESEISQRQARLAEINHEVAFLEEQISRTSAITEEYQALERKEGILQEAYEDYLRKFKNAELSRSMETAQQGAQLTRLEAAVPPTKPVIPPIAFTVGAIFVSLAASLAFVVLLELLNPVVIDAAHLEKLSSLPTLGSIPPVA